MRTLSSEVQALLAADRTQLAFHDMYTITLASGTVLRWSGSDRLLSWDGNAWELGPGIDRDHVVWAMGLAASEMMVNLYVHNPVYQIDLQPIAAAIAGGVFDGASLRLDRGISRASSDVIEGVIANWFTGRIVSRQTVAVGYRMTVRTPLELLDQPVPNSIYTPACRNVLFDATCRLNPATYRDTGTVTSAPSRISITSNSINGAGANYYRLGKLRFTSGKNAGHMRMIRTYDNVTGKCTFNAPFPAEPELNDEFEVWAGCDKSRATCAAKFNNRINFRGQPFIPAPETVV